MAKHPPLTHATIFQRGRRHKCPKCGEGDLYQSFLKLRDKCPNCGLKFDAWAAADAPSFFVMCFVITVIPILALIVEMKYEPAFWLHAVVWTPAVLISCLWLLPIVKSIWLGLEYKNKTGSFEKKAKK